MGIDRRRDGMDASGELILNSVIETQRATYQRHENR